MKNLKLFVFGIPFILCCTFGSAQLNRINEQDLNKPRLFQNLPSDVQVTPEELTNLLTHEVGEMVNINLSPVFQFQGRVVSTASKYENTIQSIVIALANYNGARLTFSKLTHPGQPTTYTGRIISFQHGDLYELAYRDNQYYFVKKKFYDLVNE